MRLKNIKVCFYTSGSESKSKSIANTAAFKTAWKTHFENNLNNIEQFERNISTNTSKKLKFKIFKYNPSNNKYFGYIGIEREALLPDVFNKTTGLEKPINLNNEDELVEKCFFTYDEINDILSFGMNHSGPRVDDLNYILNEIHGASEDFVPIWHSNALQSLLQGSTIVKTVDLTIALPKTFSGANINLSNSWSKDIIDMMGKHGMSRLHLSFSGRAAVKKKGLNYLSSVVTEGIAELVSFFGNSGASNSSPKITKADILPAGDDKSSLLDKEISSIQKLKVVKGYPTLSDIEASLEAAFDQRKQDLTPYFKPNRP